VRISHPDHFELSGALVPIGQGADGIRNTTHAMAQLARLYQFDPHLRAVAMSIVQLAPPKDEPGEVRALFDFVRHAIRYVGDVVDTETLQTPDVTLKLRQGDCDDKALLLAVLLRTLKYPAAFVVTGYTHPGEYEHVYVGVLLDGDTYLPLDPTEDGPMGWEPPNPVAKYIERVPD
jgi:transglutaminase-like putative cysteine protease